MLANRERGPGLGPEIGPEIELGPDQEAAEVAFPVHTGSCTCAGVALVVLPALDVAGAASMAGVEGVVAAGPVAPSTWADVGRLAGIDEEQTQGVGDEKGRVAAGWVLCGSKVT